MTNEEHHADYSSFEGLSKRETLEQVVMSYEALVDGQTNWVCNLANASSLVWHAYHSLKIPINWAGFYINDSKVADQLILGPFQGKVACQTIRYGQGVCGAAAKTEQTQLVKDVNTFPGHIACDGDTNSEIVVPIIYNGKTVGVLDIDCIVKEGFDELDQEILETLVQKIATSCDFSII